MKREDLINEIAFFCFDHDMLIGDTQLKRKIDNQLDEPAFVESLINIIMVKARNTSDIDLDTAKEMLLALEEIRLDLEFYDY